jgi:hypothetical protein
MKSSALGHERVKSPPVHRLAAWARVELSNRERDLPYGLHDSLCTLALQFTLCAGHKAPQQGQHSIRVGG